MNNHFQLGPIFSRKIISASISGSLFAILLGLMITSPFGEEIDSVGEYFHGVLLSTPVYLMYSFPVILVYGTVTSTISDYIASLITKFTSAKLEIYLSFVFHVLFGLVLLGYSLLAAVLFFLIDRVLARKEIASWKSALKSLCLPVMVWIVFMGGVYVVDSIIDY